MSRIRRGRLASALVLAGAALLAQAQAAPAAHDGPQLLAVTVCADQTPAVVLAPGTLLHDCAEAPEMVAIPGGAFRMGDILGSGYDYERPVHRVQVQEFLIGRYEVTVGEWLACVRSGMCPMAGAEGASATPRLPVAGISWDEAQIYVAWLSQRSGRAYRLPSEAEWEYAARAGSDDQYTWGNTETSICLHANILDVSGKRAHPNWNWAVGCDDGYAEAAPVGSFPSNRWGLYDMIGNVWEWVADCWHGNYDGAPANAAAWMEADCTKHVNRGGGWGNHARTARVSTRDGDVHSARSDGLGFRVARSMVYAEFKPAAPAPSAAVVPGGAVAAPAEKP